MLFPPKENFGMQSTHDEEDSWNFRFIHEEDEVCECEEEWEEVEHNKTKEVPKN